MVILYNNNTIAEEKEEEMENWIANDVIESVEDEGQRYVSEMGYHREGERRNNVHKSKASSERL